MNKLRVNKTKTNSRPIIFTVWKLTDVSWGPIWHYQFLKGSRVSHQCVQYQWFSRNASEIAYSSGVQILSEIWYLSANTGLIFALIIYGGFMVTFVWTQSLAYFDSHVDLLLRQQRSQSKCAPSISTLFRLISSSIHIILLHIDNLEK